MTNSAVVYSLRAALPPLLALFVVGCVTTAPNPIAQSEMQRDSCQASLLTANLGKEPKNYKSIITSYMRTVLKDAQAAKYEWSQTIGPRKGYAFNIEMGKCMGVGWAVCVPINGKNSYGAYTGYQNSFFLIRDGAVIHHESKSGSPFTPWNCTHFDKQTISAATETQNNAAKSEGLSVSAYPENAGGISLTVPSNAKNGNVVPVNVNLTTPLMPQDILIIAGDGEKALEVRTERHPISMVSTRLRLSDGKVSAYVVRNNGQVNSVTQDIRVGSAAGLPPANGNYSTEHKVRSNGKEVKMLFSNDMAFAGHISQVRISPANGGVITATFSRRLSANPYFGLESNADLGNVSVAVSI